MKRNIVKNITALLLTALLAVGALVPAFADTSVQPVVFVMGIYENALYSDPQTAEEYRLFPPTNSEALEITAHFAVDLTLGSQAQEFSKAATEAGNTIYNMLAPILCQPDGTSMAQNIGPRKFMKSLDNYTDTQMGGSLTKMAQTLGSRIGAQNCYLFTYDFRLYPQSHATELRDFIKHVKQDSGASKVRIVASGFGGIVANCYLNLCMADAEEDVSAVNFFTSLIGGSALVGDIMTGNLVYTVNDYADPNEMETHLDIYNNLWGRARGSAFIRWMNDQPQVIKEELENYYKIDVKDNFSQLTKGAATFSMWLTNYILNGQSVWQNAGLDYDLFVRWSQTNLYDSYLKRLLRTMPGLWAMIPPSDFNEAIQYMYENEGVSGQVIDGTLEQKLNEYYDIQTDAGETLRNARANGINVTLLAGYNLQILPVAASMGVQSDGIVDTTSATLGATDVQLNDYWLRATTQCEDKSHNHMSRDDWEDASTCELPESTWIVKNLPHNGVEDVSMAKVVEFLISPNGQRTVWDSALYPQFMYYSGISGQVGPYSAKDPGVGNYKLGDVDLDGDVDVEDARICLRASVGLGEPLNEDQLRNADINGNGAPDAADARSIMRCAVGLIKLGNDGEIPVE